MTCASSDAPQPVSLAGLTISQVLDAVAAADAAPGGGAAAALACALAASLAAMAAGLTLDRPLFASVQPEMALCRQQALALQRCLCDLADQDSLAYRSVSDAWRLPRDNAAARQRRGQAIQSALREAVRPPLSTAVACVRVLDLLARIHARGNPHAHADVAMGGRLALAALQGSVQNARVNLQSLPDDAFRHDIEAQLARCLTDGRASLASMALADECGGNIRG